jgi:tRNA1Val (adenine37-N6)-methyltransferase
MRYETSSPAFAELGAGCGLISTLLCKAGFGKGLALELQPEMAQCAVRTIAANQCNDALQLVVADIRNLDGIANAGAFPVVVSNPPYYPAGAGRLSVESVEAVARHELQCTMGDVLSAARYLLPPGGRAYLIYPAMRMPDLFSQLERFKLRCEILQWVHPAADRPAGHFLVRLLKASQRTLTVLEPLVTHQNDGSYGPWFERLRRKAFPATTTD